MLMTFDYFNPSLFCRVHSVHTTKQTPRQKWLRHIWLTHPPPCSERMKHIDKQKDISKIVIKKEAVNGKHCLQRAVWRNGGISPAATAVRTWKLLPRKNVSEAATAPSRWDVVRKGRNCGRQ